jgi:hypothetical protein
MNSKEDRRKKVSKPKVFNEKRESMLLIKSAEPADIYVWALSLMFMSTMVFGLMIYAYSN